MPSCFVFLSAAKYGKKVAVLDYVSPSSQGKEEECRFHFGLFLDGLYIMWPVVSRLLVFLLTGMANLTLYCSRFHLGPWWNLCKCGMYSKEADASGLVTGRVI